MGAWRSVARELRRAGLLGVGLLASLALGLGGVLAGCDDPRSEGARLARACRGERPPPHIVLVSIDSLRADRLDAYGHYRTTAPTLTRWAEEGALFEQVIAPSSWTLPSHVSLFTGLPAGAHRVGPGGGRLAEGALTLAEVLAEQGYHTGAVVSGPYLQEVHGSRQGFAFFDERAVERARGGQSIPLVLRGAEDFLADWQRGHAQQPFFLFLHVWDVHYDYEPPPPFDRLFAPGYEGELTGRDFALDPRIHRDMPREDLEYLKALYDGETRYTDGRLAFFFSRLERLGVADDTILAVTSDHGDEFFEHGAKGHALHLYDEIVRVPWILRYPRCVEGGQRIPAQARLMDVAPTLLGLAGIGVPEDFGRTASPRSRAFDFSPWLLGASEPLPELPAVSRSLRVGKAERTSWRSGRWKLVRLQTAEAVGWELYDLRADPREGRDLAGRPEAREILERLQAELEAWEAGLGRHDLARPVPRDERREELLRALGYLEDDVEDDVGEVAEPEAAD